mmetsp:Transcript_30204/g.86537  ORF Transcript_30204/g.86537 Transcript_30204/m.86537 type:complete len:291 (-) Transcript_30204:2259-3131(-)
MPHRLRSLGAMSPPPPALSGPLLVASRWMPQPAASAPVPPQRLWQLWAQAEGRFRPRLVPPPRPHLGGWRRPPPDRAHAWTACCRAASSGARAPRRPGRRTSRGSSSASLAGPAARRRQPWPAPSPWGQRRQSLPVAAAGSRTTRRRLRLRHMATSRPGCQQAGPSSAVSDQPWTGVAGCCWPQGSLLIFLSRHPPAPHPPPPPHLQAPRQPHNLARSQADSPQPPHPPPPPRRPPRAAAPPPSPAPPPLPRLVCSPQQPRLRRLPAPRRRPRCRSRCSPASRNSGPRGP